MYVKILLFGRKTQGKPVFHNNTSLIIHILQYHKQIYLFQPFFSHFAQFSYKFLTVDNTSLKIAKDNRPGGATVARLTPVQKVACSNHVRVTTEVLNTQPDNGRSRIQKMKNKVVLLINLRITQ